MYNYSSIIKELENILENKENAPIFQSIPHKLSYTNSKDSGGVNIYSKEGIDFLRNNLDVLNENSRHIFLRELNEIESEREKTLLTIELWIESLRQNAIKKSDLIDIFQFDGCLFKKFCADNNLVVAFIAPRPIIMKDSECTTKYKKELTDFMDFKRYQVKNLE